MINFALSEISIGLRWWGAAIITILAFCLPTDAQVAIPNLSIIGTKWGSSSNIWPHSTPSEFPSQIAIDYTKNGTIKGFVCEYAAGMNTLAELRTEIQQELKVLPKLSKPLLWRVENRKFTVMIDADEKSKTVKLIVVSIDKNVLSGNISPRSSSQSPDVTETDASH